MKFFHLALVICFRNLDFLASSFSDGSVSDSGYHIESTCFNMLKENVCCVMDFDGFELNLSGKTEFLVREMAFVKLSDDSLFYTHALNFNLAPFDNLGVENLRKIQHITEVENGLRFYPRKEEDVLGYESLDCILRSLYTKYATSKRYLVAYKRNECIGKRLADLHIPSVILEELGCPSYDELLALMPEYCCLFCGLHSSSRFYCPLARVMAFRDWLH